MEDETPAIEAARRTCFFAQSAFWRGNGRRLGNAARIAPSLFRPGDERILREDPSCEQRPAGQPRRSGAPAEPMAGSALLRRVCFRRGNGHSSGMAARIAPSLFRPGDERILREGQSCEQRPAGRLRRSGAPAEAMAGRGRAFAAGLLQAREWPQTWRRGAWRQGLRRRCFDRAMSASCGKTSPANSVRQGSRGGRARRQSRWPGGGAFLCRLPFGAGMAAVPATRRDAARIAPSLFRPGDERILREDQSCEQRPAGRLRRSGAPAEPMAGRGGAFAAGLLQAREWPQTWQCGKDCGASSRWRSKLRGGSSVS